MKITVFKDLFKSKDVAYHIEVEKIVDRIKNGKKDVIAKINIIRKSTDKEEIKRVKNSLAAILFNGLFSERQDSGMIEHSGLCILDFDHYNSVEEMMIERANLIKDKYTFICFISPSGKGLKVVIRIPKSDAQEHKRRFFAYKNYIKSENFDPINFNLSRVCFESFDPTIYYNENSEIFEEIQEETGFIYTEKTPICILNDEQKKIDIIMKFKWSKSFIEGERNAFIFDIASAFCEYGISEYTAENFLKQNYSCSNFKESEIKTSVKSAYRKRTFDCKYFEDYQKVDKIKVSLRNGIKDEKIKESLNVELDVINEIKNEIIKIDEIFWEVVETKTGEKIVINPFKYCTFLVRSGFGKFYPEKSETPIFVKIIENKVKTVSVEQIKDFVLNYLLKKELINVWNYCSKSSYLFQDTHLNMIDSIDICMLKDTKDISFKPFKNTVLKVEANNIELIDYIDIDGYIWEDQIIDRDFELVENFQNDFQDMVWKVCANDEERILGLETTLGYCLHNFKDKSDQKAIIFNDQEIDDNPNGGSGKSLMVTALNYIRRVVKIDGKIFDPKKGDFVYQRISLDTNIIAFDDVKKNFNFENLFSLVSEGIPVNRKNKEEIYIPFEKSPKIIITTNYVIKGTGTSHYRRRHEIEFYQYFNLKRTPETEYGRLLVDSWNKEDWLKFDNYMIKNLIVFLQKRLQPVVSINANVKRFIQATTKDFFDWVEDGNIEINTRYYNNQAFSKFIEDNKQYRELNNKVFLTWIKEYSNYLELEFKKDRDHLGRYFEILEN